MSNSTDRSNPIRIWAILATVALLAACTDSSSPSTTAAPDAHTGTASQADITAAMLANAAFQDVSAAEAAGYGNTMEALGCFENPGTGGMGLHYLNDSLMDGSVDLTRPEALVYELGDDGEIVGLVAHEYIIPVDAWTDSSPPQVFGMPMHQHPTLPLWVLHVWLWKDNPAGIFEDWNPAVRMCPDGVPVFGVDLP